MILRVDLTGHRYDRLVVVCFNGRDIKGNALWTCLCDCGNTVKAVVGYSLRNGNTRSCGCLKRELTTKMNSKRTGIHNPNYKDEKGQRYVRLIVIAFAYTKNNSCCWRCRCDCGREIVVQGSSLRNGNTMSCGCYHSEIMSEKKGVLGTNYKTGGQCGRATKEQLAFHEKISARDNYTCQDCGKMQVQELIDVGCRLSVHHKNGDHFDNRDENAVTLCEVCHHVYSMQQKEQMKIDVATEAAFLADDSVWLANQLADIE